MDYKDASSLNTDPLLENKEQIGEEAERISEMDLMSLKLRNLNAGAFLFQLVTGVILLCITDYRKKYFWYTDFSGEIDEQGNFGKPEANQVAGIAVGMLAGIFLLLSAVDHFLVAFPFRAFYEKMLINNQNHFRWTEYAISASLMRVMIGMLSGITNIHLLFAIFGLTFSTMCFGALYEADNGKKRNRGEPISSASFWIGFIPHAMAWSIILCYFFEGVANSDPPAFVWSIIFIIFFLDLTFALLLYAQWNIFDDYLKGEVGFIILSFTSKQLLAWINYGGGNR